MKNKYQYHHIGIPTTKVQKNERYSSKFKMYTSDAKNSQFNVQYHRFEKVLLEPYYPLEGFKVALIEDGGIPIELIETKLTDEEIWNLTNKKSALYPDKKD